ncbi:MAG: hypothetical protein V2A79_16200 [Planctomycetota bacterium]
MLRSMRALLALAMVCHLTGCGASGGGGGGVLNQLDTLPDEDGDTFSEVPPPEGVDFDVENSVAVSITNTITRSQAMAAAGSQLPSVVSSSISLRADVAVDLTYPGGITQHLSGSFPIGPLDLAFEVACPESIEVLVTLVASAPLVGSRPVSTFGPYVFTRGEGEYAYACGALVSVSTFINEATGEPDVDLDVE